MDSGRTHEQVGAEWGRQSRERWRAGTGPDPTDGLPEAVRVAAEAGNGLIHLRWDPVPGAAGYVIERRSAATGPIVVDHGGSDVPAVPGTEFSDTGIEDGIRYTYRIAAVAGNDDPVRHWSEPVSASTTGRSGGVIEVTVDTATTTGTLDRVWWLVGSERLTQLRFGDDGHGHRIGAEFAEALRLAHDDLGVTAVRAHAILHDDNHVVTRTRDGELSFDFTMIDELYDHLLRLGLHPVVELGFMPAALARDAEQTVFTYRGIISPPRDWQEWHRTVRALAVHLVQRYGVDEVRRWGFEVWNEPNLGVFWSGGRDEYLRLYAESARALKSVDDRLTVGGPSTAAAEWMAALAEFAQTQELSLDFVTTHTYGNLPLDFRDVLAEHGLDDMPLLWTEWGVGSTHFGAIHDEVAGAPFILSGFLSAQKRLAALSYWVISDHFEELGRPPRLFHDGFGLLTVGNLRKPRYWAVHLAAHQGDAVLRTQLSGSGAGTLVQTWATRHDSGPNNGCVDVLVWNGTVNAALKDGDPRLRRQISLRVFGLERRGYDVDLSRVDSQHSNILNAAPAGVDWPDEEQFTALRAADQLSTERLPRVLPSTGTAELTFDLPQPGVARLRFRPVETSDAIHDS